MINLLKSIEANEVYGGVGASGILCSCTVNITDVAKYMGANGDQDCIDGCGKIYAAGEETKEASWGEVLNTWGKRGAGIAIATLEVGGGFAVAGAIVGYTAAATIAGASTLYFKIKKL